MTTFIVSIREVHVQRVRIEAETKDAAIRRVYDGDGEYLDGMEYAHTLDPETATADVEQKS